MTKMAIQLDKILADIAKEKALHPNNGGSASKQEQDEAWQRIGRLNKLSVHESRSIFIVLQKKYDQEKLKPNSTWKLFNLMQQIHQEHKPAVSAIKVEDEQVPMEEVEEYEMLEVQEQEEDDDSMVPANQFSQPANSTGSGSASSDGESPSKSLSSNSPEKSEEKLKPMADTPRPTYQLEERKLLNTLANNSPRAATSSSVTSSNSNSNPVSLAAAAVLQKKGITLKKTPGIQRPTSQAAGGSGGSGASGKGRTTIQLPDSLKRKLSEDYGSSSSSSTPMARKGMKFNSKQTQPQQQQQQQQVNNSNQNESSNSNSAPAASAEQTASGASAAASPPVVHTTTAQLMQVKRERESNQTPPPGINIITIPAAVNGVGGAVGGATSSTAATMASTSVASTNGYSPHAIEELDFKNDIIFESKSASNNGGGGGLATSCGPEIINLGNFNNSLPPTFFKNLCNSSRHEALGLYVANVMNRISGRAAAKLELGILRAIVDVQSDELEQ